MHLVHQVVTFASGEDALMHPLLPAGGVAVYQPQRGSQAATVGYVASGKDEVAFVHDGGSL